MKKIKLCMCILTVVVAVAAGIGCYYWYTTSHPRTRQGGILVHEHDIIHPDEQEC